MILFVLALAALVGGAVFGFRSAGKRITASAKGLTSGQTLAYLGGVIACLVGAFYLSGWGLVLGAWAGEVGFGLLLMALGIFSLAGGGWFAAYLARFVHYGSTAK